MRSLILLLGLLLPVSVLAFDRGQATRRVLIQAHHDDPVTGRICESLLAGLEAADLPAELIRSDLRFSDRSDVRWIVRIVTVDSDSEWSGGIGVGAPAGLRADVDLLRSTVAARVDLIDPASLAVVRSYPVAELSIRSAVSSVGLGGRYGFIRIPTTFGRSRGVEAAAEAVGARIASHLILEAFPEDEIVSGEL